MSALLKFFLFQAYKIRSLDSHSRTELCFSFQNDLYFFCQWVYCPVLTTVIYASAISLYACSNFLGNRLYVPLSFRSCNNSLMTLSNVTALFSILQQISQALHLNAHSLCLSVFIKPRNFTFLHFSDALDFTRFKDFSADSADFKMIFPTS